MRAFAVLVAVTSAFNFNPEDLANYFEEQFGDDPDIDASELKDYFSNFEAPRLTAAFSSCKQADLKKHSSKMFGATLNCAEGESVGHLSDCSWSCNSDSFLKFGADKTNIVTCRDGEWRGLKRPVCVERCLWKDLRRLQINGEFSHCQADDNLGQAKYLCKVTSADTQNGIKRSKRARCSCADSRNSGKCSWVEKGVDR